MFGNLPFLISVLKKSFSLSRLPPFDSTDENPPSTDIACMEIPLRWIQRCGMLVGKEIREQAVDILYPLVFPNIAGWKIPIFNRKFTSSFRVPHFPGIRYVSLLECMLDLLYPPPPTGCRLVTTRMALHPGARGVYVSTLVMFLLADWDPME